LALLVECHRIDDVPWYRAICWPSIDGGGFDPPAKICSAITRHCWKK